MEALPTEAKETYNLFASKPVLENMLRKPNWAQNRTAVETVFHSKQDAMNFMSLLAKLTNLSFYQMPKRDDSIELWISRDQGSFVQLELFRGYFIRFTCSIGSNVTVNLSDPIIGAILERAERNETIWASIGFLRYYCENLRQRVGLLSSDDWCIYALTSDLVSKTVVNELREDKHFKKIQSWLSTVALEAEASIALDLSTKLMSVAVGELAVSSFPKTALKTWNRRQVKMMDSSTSEQIWGAYFASKKRYNKKLLEKNELVKDPMAKNVWKTLTYSHQKLQRADNQQIDESESSPSVHPIQCPRCDLFFPRVASLQEHLIDAHQQISDPGFRVACVRCGKSLSTAEQLETHRENCQPGSARFNFSTGPPKRGRKPLASTGGLKYRCEHCEREFDSAPLFLTHHHRTHDDCSNESRCSKVIDRRFVCRKEPCGYMRFSSWEDLQFHFLSMHYRPPTEPVITIAKPPETPVTLVSLKAGESLKRTHEEI
ncbi:unnamed protein product, partial [Mesorhabditis belari]|uniref:C2H2-type domain-containing protein n=1 Tax=Mesorhabditis belari TaxID=2138241 RepID=A0AAF3EU15_9BILA